MTKTGLALSGAYLLLAAYLVATQGLFGESFIALILGMPWTLLLAFFEFGGAGGPLLYVLLLSPIAINAALLYWIGSILGSRMRL